MDPLEWEAKRIQKDLAEKKRLQEAMAASKKEENEWKATIDHNNRLIEHQREFRCQIDNCTNTSRGPTRYDRNTSSEYADWAYAWYDPLGIEKCRLCGKFACAKKHFFYDEPESAGPMASYMYEENGREPHDGICMECFIVTNGGTLPKPAPVQIAPNSISDYLSDINWYAVFFIGLSIALIIGAILAWPK